MHAHGSSFVQYILKLVRYVDNQTFTHAVSQVWMNETIVNKSHPTCNMPHARDPSWNAPNLHYIVNKSHSTYAVVFWPCVPRYQVGSMEAAETFTVSHLHCAIVTHKALSCNDNFNAEGSGHQFIDHLSLHCS